MKFANIFNSIRVQKQKFNTFNLSHDVKFSTRMGQLTPILATEVVPGDRWNLAADSLIRMAPMIAPVMHRFDATMHFFFVPNRLLWDNWEGFITGNEQVEHPRVRLNAPGFVPTDAQKKFLDYMGVPPTGELRDINALPLAAYQMIYNEYYRDQNLVAEVDYKVSSGDQTLAKKGILTTMRLRAWEHDYFTSALPFAQKGADVEIPLGDVMLKDDLTTSAQLIRDSDGNLVPATILNSNNDSEFSDSPSVGQELFLDPNGTLEVGSTTINNLRRAFKLQEWLEKNARGGTRYIESILSHFGIKSSDKRLQRPEYITGTKSPIVISEVLNTAGIDGELPQGNMSGHGVSVGSGHNGSYFAEEHGWIIGIMSVMPKPAYMQGLHKQFSRSTALDYYWPSFAHLGEQEIKNKELYIDSTSPEATFGYVPRYSEYKYMPSRVAGEFRSSLDFWHLARKFGAEPTLSQEFIECDPADLTRIFAVEAEDVDNLYCHVFHKITARRPMPVYGTPML